jgi:tetratricopeptide (TPR) repeat protein
MMKTTSLLILLLLMVNSCTQGQTTKPQESLKQLSERHFEQLHTGQLEEAIQTSEKLISLDSTESVGYYYKGLALLKMSKYALAIQSFTEAIERDSLFGWHLYYRAECLLKLGEKEKSFIDVYNGLKLDTNFEFTLAAGSFISDNFDEVFFEEMFFKLEGGQIEFQRDSDGIKDGPWAAYYPSGVLWKKGHFKKGKKDGSEQLFYENGQLHIDQVYVDGIGNGPYKSYDENGTLVTEGILVDGNLKWSQ